MNPSVTPLRTISIGTDIIECVRIAQMIEKHGELFLQRVFTKREILYCSSRRSSTQHYAGRWAAKEAALKALGTGWARGVHWTDIEVQHESGGKPTLVLANRAGEIAISLGIQQMLISISHCRNYAIAYVNAVG
jgi:holo-[acyl-carrier protein] synthase